VVERFASGRTAEVFEWGVGRVLKLDRRDWNGLSAIEASVLATVTAAGVPAPRLHDVVMVDDRHGVVLERIDGPILSEVIAASIDPDALALAFVELHCSVNERVVAGLPDLVGGLENGLRTSGLEPALVETLVSMLGELDDGRRVLCHFDLHPANVIVASDRWVVIDWLTASSGPPDADFARTLVLDPPNAESTHGTFMTTVRREGAAARRLDRSRLEAWIRVVAGARLAEGFDGEHAEYLTALARGESTLAE
jgi:tRNA A-37 threonylcarbamoyl transferase component Bud32